MLTDDVSKMGFFLRPLVVDTQDDNDDYDDNNGLERAYLLFFLFVGITSIMMLASLPFFNKYWKKRRDREAAERRVVATKLADPIREAHLTNLMENFSMVLSKSDICDGEYDSEEEEQLKGEPAIETRSETPPSSNDVHKEEENSDDLSKNNDIEMQLPKEKSSEGKEEEVDGDSSSLECDNSQCPQYSFCIPIPGQIVGTCGATNFTRQTNSDGCAVCMNSFEVGQKVVWSSNPECTHVFHHQCLHEWFVAVGTNAWKAEASCYHEMESTEIQEKICKFPKLCPFCRRDFFLEANQEAAEDTTTNNGNTSSSGSSNSSNDDGDSSDIPTTLPSSDLEEV